MTCTVPIVDREHVRHWHCAFWCALVRYCVDNWLKELRLCVRRGAGRALVRNIHRCWGLDRVECGRAIETWAATRWAADRAVHRNVLEFVAECLRNHVLA